MHDVDPGLIGREAELARLVGALERGEAGQPAFLLVTGEAGIGKTRLLRAAVGIARASGIRALWGTAIESGRSIPYLPLLAPLREAAEEPVPSPSPSAGRGAPAPMDHAGTVIREALLGMARSGGVAANRGAAAYRGGDVTNRGPGRASRGLAGAQPLDTARLLEATFDVLVRRPTLLVVDDVQWADESTLTVLDYLAHRATDVPLVVVAVARDDDPSLIAGLPIADGRRFARIELGRLSRAEVGLQAASLLGSGVAPGRLTALHRRTAGNPFYVEQLLADSGVGDGLGGPGTSGAPPPASLRALVLRRMEGFEPGTRRALDALAILGRPAEPAEIARVADLPAAHVEDDLRAARTAGVTVADEGGIALRHPLFGEVLEAELTGPQRRRLHGGAAALEADARGDAASIANHWWHAGDAVRAWSAARAAARAALETFAFAEARLHLECALETWPAGEPGQADAQLAAARAAWLTGDAPAALGFAAAARELDPGRMDAAIAVGSYAWDAGRRAEGVAAFAEATALAGPDADPVLVARATWGAGRAAVAQGRPEEATRLGLEASRLATGMGDLVLRSEGLALAAMSAAFQGRLDGAPWLDDAVDAALRSGAPHAVGHSFQFLVDLRALGGETEAALDAARRGIEACTRLGLARTHGSDLRGRAALLLLDVGRPGDAEEVLAPSDPRAFPALARGLLAMRRGAFEAADAALDEAATGGAIGGPGALGGWLELARVELAWLRGDAAGVARWLDAIPVVPGVWGADVGAWAARWRALAAGRNADIDAGGLVAAVRPHPDPRLRAALEAEVLAALAGAGDLDAWGRAADAWDGASRPWEASWARLREAEAAFAVRDSAAGRAALENVLATAAGLGAPPLRERALALGRRARIRVDVPGRSRPGPDEPTARELQVLALVAEGMTNPQIGERLFLSPKTVGIHVSRLLDKLGARTRGEAVAVARRRGLLEA